MAAKREESGYLDVKLPSKLKGFGWTSWRRRWVVLHHLTDLADNKKIIRLTFYSKENGHNEKGHTLYVEDIKASTRICCKTKLFAFTVQAGSPQESSIYLAGKSETETQHWIDVFSNSSSDAGSEYKLDIGEVYHETRMIDNEASQRLGLSSRYLMVVSLNALSVHSCSDGSLCHEWRLNHLLRFYVDEDVAPEDKNKILVIIAGRASSSGSGLFSFFFHNADAHEVISTIASCIQRSSMRRETHVTNPEISHFPRNNENKEDACDTRIKRAGSCGLPSLGTCGSISVDVEHKRQTSMPYELERAIFTKPHGKENGRQSRRSTIVSRTSVQSDDNGKSKNLMRMENKKTNMKCESNSIQENISNVNSDSDASKHTDSSMGSSNQRKKDRKKSGSDSTKLVNREKNLDGIREGETLAFVPNYFRRPSWFSDTTSADVESSSSEEYREKTIKLCPSGKGMARKRAFSVRSSTPPLLSPEETVKVSSAEDQRSSQSGSSDNEADDEVDIDEENEETMPMTRKTSAGSHLYQELPELANNSEEHVHCTHCKLCHKAPSTPPELPPRLDLVQRERYNSEPIFSGDEKRKSITPSRERSVSETVSGDSSVSKGNLRNRPSSRNPEKSSENEAPVKFNLIRDKSKSGPQNMSRVSQNSDRRNSKTCIYTKELTSLLMRKKKSKQEEERPRKSSTFYVEAIPGSETDGRSSNLNLLSPKGKDVRKISVLSGVYHDIEDVQSDCSQSGKSKIGPPDLPPRCQNNSKKAHKNDDAHYEDLDRYRKNIQKYFGIPLSELNQPPPPLPSRPQSMPAPPVTARERTRSRLRSVGRKKKISRKFAESYGISTGTPTDDSASTKRQDGVHRVQAWPLPEGNHPRSTKRHNSLTTENSIYSLQDDASGSNDYYTEGHSGHRYACFQCVTCGAANQVYSSPPQTYRPVTFPPTPPTSMNPHTPTGVPIPFHLLPPMQAPWYTNQIIHRQSAGTESTHHYSDSVTSDMQSAYTESDPVHHRPIYANNHNPDENFIPTAGELPEADNDIYTDMSGGSGVTGSHYLSMDSFKQETPPQKPGPATSIPTSQTSFSPVISRIEPIYVNWPPRTYKDFRR